MPTSVSPMLASLIEKPFSDSDWYFEPKLDGYRLVALIHDGKVKLLSRRGLDITLQYPYVAESLAKQPEREMALDGELVALDESGRTCFNCLQNHANSKPVLDTTGRKLKYIIIYYVFDILHYAGQDLRALPLSQRKQLLKKILVPDTYLRSVEYFEKEGEALYKASIDQGLEGIVAKKKDSIYEAGIRSKTWLKIKNTKSDEFVIAGYTQGLGNRSKTFGALVLGTYDAHGELSFSGHVGTGFDDATQVDLLRKLESLKSVRMPFAVKPVLKGPVIWLKPELMAEVKYAEITPDGLLRAPVFMRLRDDKSPIDVRPATTAASLENNIPEIIITDIQALIDDILTQLTKKRADLTLEVQGNRISLTNLDRVLWPATERNPSFTKRDLIAYMTKISPYFLPHLKDRPLTLTRYPNGISGESFYQKHSENPPDFVTTVPLQERTARGQDYLICNNLSTLLWLAQLANIDIHSWFSRITPEPKLLDSSQPVRNTPDYFSHYPDFIIFDLDPYIYSGKEPKSAEPELNRTAYDKTCQVSFWLKELLNSLSLNSFIKTSGQTGLHIFVPIVRQFDFSAVHSAAKTISTFLFEKHSKVITLDWAVAKRTGKIFVDYNQNARGKTLASIYSPRHSPYATVSTPLHWDEIDKVFPQDFNILNVPERAAKMGDLWADILDNKKDLSKIIERQNGENK